MRIALTSMRSFPPCETIANFSSAHLNWDSSWDYSEHQNFASLNLNNPFIPLLDPLGTGNEMADRSEETEVRTNVPALIPAFGIHEPPKNTGKGLRIKERQFFL